MLIIKSGQLEGVRLRQRGKEIVNSNKGKDWLINPMTSIISSHCDILDVVDGPIGLVADSHGNNSLLREAIGFLESMNAEMIVHLGDICDVQMPEVSDEAVDMLKAHGVMAVVGNNEGSIIRGLPGYLERVMRADTISYLRDLPYILKMGDFIFTHSTPFNWPAATRRPLASYLPFLAGDDKPPFSILFRGHSHSPSVIEIEGERIGEVDVEPGKTIPLHVDRIHVITVGAVEDGLLALFMPDRHEVRFFNINSI
jgi:predicted phosphodiesterase